MIEDTPCVSSIMIAKCLFKPDKNIKFAEASDKILPKVHKSGLTAKLGRKFTRGPGIQISGEDPAGRGPDGLPGSGYVPRDLPIMLRFRSH